MKQLEHVGIAVKDLEAAIAQYSTLLNTPIAKFLDRNGEGIHHLAFEVDDIAAEVDRLASDGFTPLQEKPFRGADNKLVAFFHPKTTHGVLVEICQEIR